MAPKDKAPPAAAPGADIASEDLKKRFSPKVIWRFLGGFGGTSFVVMVVMIAIYMKMSGDPPSPLEVPMQHLRSTMANSLQRPKLNYANAPAAIEVANEVGELPPKLEEAANIFQAQKAEYKSLFKSKAKSTGSWENFGNNLYYVSQGEKSWYDAENFCVSRDAHLASVLTKEEQSFITSHLDEPAWIGLTDEHEEGSWEWTDGSRLNSQYWFTGNPGGLESYTRAEKDCASISPSADDFNWNNADCHERKRWVCKENLDAKARSRTQ